MSPVFRRGPKDRAPAAGIMDESRLRPGTIAQTNEHGPMLSSARKLAFLTGTTSSGRAALP
jgi:hypothetical protein